MFVVGNFFRSITEIIDTLLNLYMWTFIISALLSWVNPDPYNPIVRFLHQITEPVLDRIRRFLPIGGRGMDFSPIVAILLISFLRSFIVRSLFQITQGL